MFFIFIKIFIFTGIWRYCESWTCFDDHKNKEIALKNKLLCELDPAETPINKTTIDVAFYTSYFDYIDTTGELTLHCVLHMKWNDSRMEWKPDENDGIKSIPAEQKDIWYPQLALFTSKHTQYKENCVEVSCEIQHSGEVTCVPACTFRTFCETNFRNWPFDIQNCTLMMGTWTSGDHVKFEDKRTQPEMMLIESGQFQMIKFKVQNNKGVFEDSNNTFPSISYNIVLERFSITEIVLVFVPAVVLAILNLCVLWLAPDCGERMYTAVINVVLHFVLLQEMAFLIPKNGHVVPVVIIYFRDSLIITTIIILETIICRGLLQRQKALPAWIKSLLDKLRGHSVGHLMFENPYVINGSPNVKFSNPPSSPAASDSTEMEEGITVEEAIQNLTTPNVWLHTVKVLDTLLFLILVLTYIIMMIGWFPDVRSAYLNEDTQKNLKIT